MAKRYRNSFMDAYVKPALVLIGIVFVIMLLILLFNKGKEKLMSEINEEVLSYEETIIQYAKKYDMQKYVPLVEAVMMQESRGKGGDVMQCSACMYNTEYATVPNGITDPAYSIEVGIQYLKHCLEMAGCKNEKDLDHIKLALQGYNYGSGYISWALEKYGEYDIKNAEEFSEKMKSENGISVYGDPMYVPHVLRFYIYND